LLIFSLGNRFIRYLVREPGSLVSAGLPEKSSIFELTHIVAACAAVFRVREHGHERTRGRGSRGQVSVERLTSYSLQPA
jgi:hypothetical protein